MSRIDRTPRSLNNFWSSANAARETTHEVVQPSSGYSSYGPQRMQRMGEMVTVPRRNVRRGVSDFVTLGATEPLFPDPAKTTAALRKEWVGGTITIRKGQWGYTSNQPDKYGDVYFPNYGDVITVKITAIDGADGDATVYIAPSIPTDQYGAGTNFFKLREVYGSGVWGRPGVFTRIANALGVKPVLLGGAVLAVSAGLLYKRRSIRALLPL